MTITRQRPLGVAAAALGTVLAVGVVASPALAARDTATDPSGDASGRGLDITRVAVDNGDHAIVARITFDASVRGDLVLSLDPRGGRGVRVVSLYRPVAHTSSTVIGRAFSDRGGPTGPVDCSGLRVRWSAEQPQVRIVLPSSCLDGGDYGAIRYAVLTEDPGGGDVDSTPDEESASGWVPRG